MFIVDQRLRFSVHSPREVCAPFFFIPQPPLRNSVICNHHLFSSGASRDGRRTGVPFKSNPERTRLKNYDLAVDHI